MGTRLIFILTALCVVAAGVATYLAYGIDRWWVYLPLALSLLLLAVLFCRIVMPSTAATRGLELIAAQDFNNRLVKVGERNADRVVSLFNAIIDKLRNERLKNLEQENFMHRIIDASPMGVMMLDFDGLVSMVNGSMLSISGIPEEEDMLGKRVEELPTDLASGIASVPLEESRVIRRGDFRMYRCYHLSFVQTGFNRHFYLLESLTEEVMKAERRAYEKVIRTMSHEVNNTMGGVRSVLDMIMETSDDADLNEVLESCSDRCDRMCSFISSYADVVRLPEPVSRKVDLAAELDTMLPFLQEIAGSGITLRLDVPGDPVTVSLDMSLMQQVIVNIVKNAAESMEGDGWIGISVSRAQEEVKLEISNNGSPISEEVSRQLFTPFFTTKREGRGLGLTLIGDILKKHGASFKLSTGEDSVTRFTIRFKVNQKS